MVNVVSGGAAIDADEAPLFFEEAMEFDKAELQSVLEKAQEQVLEADLEREFDEAAAAIAAESATAAAPAADDDESDVSDEDDGMPDEGAAISAAYAAAVAAAAADDDDMVDPGPAVPDRKSTRLNSSHWE